jgi:hypothetical protein
MTPLTHAITIVGLVRRRAKWTRGLSRLSGRVQLLQWILRPLRYGAFHVSISHTDNSL